MKARMIFVAMAGVLFVCVPALSDELLVPDEYVTIQAAVDAAVDGDVIIVADGIYTGKGGQKPRFWRACNNRSLTKRASVCHHRLRKRRRCVLFPHGRRPERNRGGIRHY